jgi:hypothetical protein
MRQRHLSFSYTLTMLILRVALLLAWLAWLLNMNLRHIMLIIIELQCPLMMSRDRDDYMSLNFLHFKHCLHVLEFISRVFFAKYTFVIRLIRIKMSFIYKMHVWSEIFNRVCFMLFGVYNL